jgi:8-amino-7-oxononanoate synthase
MADFLKQKLDERMRDQSLRTLQYHLPGIDFLSNDYLGLARSEELHQRIQIRMDHLGFLGNGGTGSRLLSGNHLAYGSLESYLKELFQAEAVLVFNSGYAANQAVVSSIPQKGDTILYDQLSHVCLKEGAWLSKAESFSFLHNDLDDLERRLKAGKGQLLVVTESVFSMDGDEAPIAEILDVCEKYGAHLIVDEAHSTGTFGQAGSGWLIEKGLADRVFARVYTFGKGIGVHGACVAGSQVLIDYLVNFGRPFIYTTSLPPHSVVSIEEAFRFLADNPGLQSVLNEKIGLFKKTLLIETSSNTAIQPILTPGNAFARHVAEDLVKQGFNVRPIVAPTVKAGTERLRICLHAFNSDQEIIQLANAINLFGS